MTKELKYPNSFEINYLLDQAKLELHEVCHGLASKLSDVLISKEISIAFAESVTGGLLMSELVRTPGISSVLKGGIVCYTAQTKIDLLGVDPKLIEKHSCESQRISSEIAEGIKDLARPKMAVGITGLASSGASESSSKPIGSIFLTIVYLGKIYETSTRIRGNRADVRIIAAIFTFNEILSILSNSNYPSQERILNQSITTKGRLIKHYA